MKPVTLRERIQWKVLLSRATQEQDLASAHDHLRTALALAEPHGYLATLLEQGMGIVSLLQSLPAGAALKPYIDTLSEAAQTSGRGGRRSGSLAPGDLSSRELTVLELLSSRLITHGRGQRGWPGPTLRPSGPTEGDPPPTRMRLGLAGLNIAEAETRISARALTNLESEVRGLAPPQGPPEERSK